MLRVFLIMAGMFVLPFLAYTLWALVTREAQAGAEAAAERPVPVQALILTGAILAALTAITLALLQAESGPAEGAYQPPRLEGGRIVPGRFEPVDETPPPPGEPAEPPAEPG